MPGLPPTYWLNSVVKILESIFIACGSLYALNGASFPVQVPVREKPFVEVVPLFEWLHLQAGSVELELDSNLRRGRTMKLQSPILRDSLLLLAVILAFGVLAGALHAQEDPAANDKAAPAGKFPAAKKSAPESAATDAGVDSDTAKEGKFDKDSPEWIFKREEWFYQQRAFPLGHIPASAILLSRDMTDKIPAELYYSIYRC